MAATLGGVTLDRVRGMGRRMPLTAFGIMVGGLSLIGVPGTAGFVSKWYLVLAALQKGQWWLAFLIVLSSLIAVVYVWRFVEVAYFRAPAGGRRSARGAVVDAGPGVGPDRRCPLLRPRHLVHRGAGVAGRGRPAAGLAVTASAWLIASLVVPLVGAGVIALCGRLPHLRDAITMLTAVLLFLCVAALVPSVLAGARPAWHFVQALPGLPVAFAIEPLGMLFALVASGLWILNSLYSIGYMHGNQEANQTRFYVCFALALMATIGIAYAANVFTLFLFYELLTLVTYPLVTHHGTEEARRGGRWYLALLIGTSTVLLLPALIFTWSAAGTTDFVAGGILQGKVTGAALGGLLALYMFGIGKAALMPFHRWLPAAMVAPTPVSALLHAVAVVKAGVFTVVKVIVYIFGPGYLAASTTVDWLVGVAGFTIAGGLGRRAADGQPEAAPGVFHGEPAVLRRARGRAAGAAVARRRGDPHRGARARQDHAVLRGRRHLHRRAQDGSQPAGRHRPPHAMDDGRLRHRRALDDRPAAGGRLHQQVVHAVGRRGGVALGHRRRARRQHAAQRRVSPAHRVPRLLPDGARRRRWARPRRGAVADGAGAVSDGGGHRAAVLPARAAAARSPG